MDQNKVMPKAPKKYLAQYCSTMAIERELVQWYSHLSNNHGGWNKRGGSAKVAKSINVEGGYFFVEGEIFQNQSALLQVYY